LVGLDEVGLLDGDEVGLIEEGDSIGLEHNGLGVGSSVMTAASGGRQ